MKHPFFLNPEVFSGKGMILFKNRSLTFPYIAIWTVHPPENEMVKCDQHLTLSEVGVVYEISVSFFDIKKGKFKVSFDNSEYGMLLGKGTWNDEMMEYKLYDTDQVKIFEANYEIKGSETYNIKSTLRLQNDDYLVLDGTLQMVKTTTAPSK